MFKQCSTLLYILTMFISCSWISLYTSTILISAKPVTEKGLGSDLDRSHRIPLVGSNRQNFRPELFRRGWRHRYFNPALNGNRARERVTGG